MSAESSNVVDLFAAFATDRAAEKDGVYTQLPKCGNLEFKIAREGNPEYQKLLQVAVKRNKSTLQSGGEAAKNKSDEIMIDVVAKSILVGWKDMVPFKGEKLPYSVDNAKKLLAMPDFMEAVMDFAKSMDNFLVEKEAAEAKN